MKNLKQISPILAALILFLSSTSCKLEGDGGDLAAKITPTAIYALPAKATSCTALASATATPDLSSPTIAYNKLVLTWTDTSRSLTIAYMDLSFYSPSLAGTGKWDAVIADQELEGVFLGSSLTMPAMTNSASPPTLTSVCGPRAGSVPLQNLNQNAFVTGQLKIIGFATDSDGNTTPVQIQVPINFQWQALQ